MKSISSRLWKPAGRFYPTEYLLDALTDDWLMEWSGWPASVNAVLRGCCSDCAIDRNIRRDVARFESLHEIEHVRSFVSANRDTPTRTTLVEACQATHAWRFLCHESQMAKPLRFSMTRGPCSKASSRSGRF